MKKELNNKSHKLFRTTATFRCIITLKNGFHKIVRMSIDKVATLNAAIKSVKEVGLLTKRYTEFLTNLELNAYDILSCKIVNERTGVELLTI